MRAAPRGRMRGLGDAQCARLALGAALLRAAGAQLKVLAPESLAGEFPNSNGVVYGTTATFGAPAYGERVIGRLVYGESKGRRHCTEEDYDLALEAPPPQGEAPRVDSANVVNIALVRRGGCTFVTKVVSGSVGGGRVAYPRRPALLAPAPSPAPATPALRAVLCQRFPPRAGAHVSAPATLRAAACRPPSRCRPCPRRRPRRARADALADARADAHAGPHAGHGGLQLPRLLRLLHLTIWGVRLRARRLGGQLLEILCS